MQYLRSWLFLTVMTASIFPYAIGVMLAAPLSHRYRFAFVKGWADLNLWMLAAICNLRYEVVGRDNIPAQNSIVFLKHSSAWETLAGVQVFPRQTWVLKRELLRIPFFGWGLALARPIAIDRGARGSAVRQVLDQGRQRLAEGLWLMIFPEGTRMAPGQTRRYGISGALLATETGRAVVPVAHNAADFWSRRSILKRAGTVRMVIGQPISTLDKRPEEVNAIAQAWIESTMREISVGYRRRAPEDGDGATLGRNA